MNGMAQAATILSTLVFFPLLYAAFGPGDFGVYIIASTVTGIAVMFDFGIGTSTVRHVAERIALRDLEGFSVVVSSTAALLAVLGVVVAVVVVVVGLSAGLLFNVTAEQEELLTRLLLIGGVMQLWSWPAATAVHVLGGLERYDLVARTSVLATLGNVMAIGLVLLMDAGPVQLMFASAAVMVAGSLMNFWSLWRVTPARRLVAPEYATARELVRGGLPIFAVGFTQFLNKEQADRLVVAVVLGPTSVALYEIAAKMSTLITQVTALPVSAVLPLASGLSARRDTAALRDLFIKGSRYISMIVAPIAIILIVLAGPFVRAWFGPGFETSVIVAQMLIGAQLFVPLYLVGDIILMATGRFSLWVRPGLLLAMTNVVLSVVLVRYVGLVGVAFGTLLAGLLELPVYARIILPETGATARQWLGAALPAYALVPLAALVAYAAAQTSLSLSLGGVAVCGGLALAAYWLAAYVVVLTAGERTLLRARMARLVGATRPGGA